MNTNDLRQSFLRYFERNAHSLVPSSSLVPGNDPSLLFTNAGMVQFKDVFLGKETRPYTRATSSQRCVRAGGKHNDLENVGYTARHHTFFEMLGNFSFGDYFKREAIQFAWNYLTQELKLPPEKLWITVFREDDEAADIWLKEIGVDPKRFSRGDEKDNFWSMGDTGPCGPCTEIFYDHGEGIPGGPPCTPEAEGDRYIEIWNLVFMQFDRSADGQLSPLAKPSVDTGMGLERIAAIMQGVHSNYDIDLFRHLIAAVAHTTHTKELSSASLRVIADHIRSTSFLITDGVRPSNEGRGYVLRRIIRRAIRHGHKLGADELFFYRLVAPLVKEMGDAYPELAKAQSTIEQVLKQEEQQFIATLDQGMKLLERALTEVHDNIIPGAVLFRLYDTYGFPPDLTADIARERNLNIDYAGFELEMEKQRQQSQASSQFSAVDSKLLSIPGETEFTGYEHLSDEGSVIFLLHDNSPVNRLEAGHEGIVVLDRTPFYAESGGQVGDKGQLFFEGGVFAVHDTQKQGLVYLHFGKVMSGTLSLGSKITAEVDAARHAIMLNHSATHLLHSALRRILGNHVVQKGSLVDADRLRFDFAHFVPMKPEEIITVERLVNQQIRANLPSHVSQMKAEDAKKTGALALFGEKYGDEVRVLRMGEFSVELCGGTHASRSGDIGLFKIISETGVAAGIRRIEAITGEKALEWVEKQEGQLKLIADQLKVPSQEITGKINLLLQQNRELLKLSEQQTLGRLKSQIDDLLERAIKINEITVLTAEIPNVNIEALRQLMDQIKQKMAQGVVVLATVADSRAQLVAGVTKNCVDRIKAGELVGYVAEQLGGKGGGRPDLAQGGGERIDQLPAALASVEEWVRVHLTSVTKSPLALGEGKGEGDYKKWR